MIQPPATLPMWSLWMMFLASALGAWLLAWQIYGRTH